MHQNQQAQEKKKSKNNDLVIKASAVIELTDPTTFVKYCKAVSVNSITTDQITSFFLRLLGFIPKCVYDLPLFLLVFREVNNPVVCHYFLQTEFTVGVLSNFKGIWFK